MRSNRMAFGARGIVALEEEQQRLDELEVANSPEAPVEDNANSLETDLVDVADQSAEVEQVGDDVEEGLDTVEALEGLREVCRTAAKNGGLERFGASAMKVSLEHLYMRAGIKRKGKVVPSLEAFGGVSDRVRSTIALEAEIGETATKVWNAIKAAIQKAIDFLVELYNKLFDGATKLKARAQKLKGQVSGVTDNGSAPKQLDNERLAAQIYIGAGTQNDATSAKRLEEELKSFYNGYPGMVDKLTKLAEDAVNASGANEITADFSNLLPGLETVANASGAGYPNAEGMSVMRSKELPGGQAFTFYIPESDEKIGDAQGGIQPHNPKGTAPTNLKVATMEKAGMEAIVPVIEAIADEVLRVKPIVAKLNDAKKKLIRLVDKAAAAEGKTEGGESANAKVGRASFKAVLNLMDKPFVQLNKYAIDTGKAFCDQVEQSIKAHGGAAAKAEEPAAAAA